MGALSSSALRCAGLALAAMLAACASAPPLAPWPDHQIEGRPLQAAGPWQVQEADISPEVAAQRGDCQATVERYLPTGGEAAAKTPLVFAHGFLRDVANHRDHARHIASWGVPVFLVGHCSGGWTKSFEGVAGGGAAVLAQFMRQVADFSGATSIVYGGFSAGGRASRIAALGDARTTGWLGLDPVDRVSREAGSVSFPMYALFAPAQSCNAQQVGRGMTRASVNGQSFEVVGTTHCHFEAPSNLLCHAACGEPGSGERNAALRARITVLATQFVRWRAGLDERSPEAGWREVPGALVRTGP